MMKTLSLFKNLTLLAVFLGSTALYAAVPPIQGQRTAFPAMAQSSIPVSTTLSELRKSLENARGNPQGIINILAQYTQTGKEVPTKLNLSGLGLNDVPFVLQHSYYVNNVRELSLTQNNLKDLKFIGSLKNLRMLAVGLNQITDIRGIKDLPNLNFFSAVRNRLNDNSINTGKESVFPPSLQTVILDGNEIRNFPTHMHLKNIRALSIKGNPINDLCWVQTMPSIQNIRVDQSLMSRIQNMGCGNTVNRTLIQLG